jgi:predicted esterase
VEVEGRRNTVTEPRPLRPAIERTIEVPRTARYYVLGAEGGDVAELWFVLHGFGQLARDFIHYFGVLADERRLVIAPEALNRYYSASASVPAKDRPVGATWMTREDRENEIKDYVRYLDLLHSAIAASHPEARTTVVGFSQGGATASRWAIHGSAKIDRLILWGATVPPDANLDKRGATFRDAHLTLVVGRKDQYVDASALAAERARLADAGVAAEIVEYDGGHSINRAVLLDLGC